MAIPSSTLYLESHGQRIVLDGQGDVVAGPQQLHDCLLVCRRTHVGAIDLQDSVTHSDLARLLRNSVRDNLEGEDQFTLNQMHIL